MGHILRVTPAAPFLEEGEGSAVGRLHRRDVPYDRVLSPPKLLRQLPVAQISAVRIRIPPLFAEKPVELMDPVERFTRQFRSFWFHFPRTPRSAPLLFGRHNLSEWRKILSHDRWATVQRFPRVPFPYGPLCELRDLCG